MYKLEELGWVEGTVPTGRIWTRNSDSTALLFEDKKVAVFPPEHITEAGNRSCFAEISVDEIKAILHQAQQMWRDV